MNGGAIHSAVIYFFAVAVAGIRGGGGTMCALFAVAAAAAIALAAETATLCFRGERAAAPSLAVCYTCRKSMGPEDDIRYVR